MADDVKNMSFEQAMNELEQIVQRLESGQEPLEQAIALYERGVALRAHCEGKLNQAQLKVETILQQPDGTLKTGELPNG